MKKLLSFVPNRIKAIYLFWVGMHITFFLFSGNFLSEGNNWSKEKYLNEFFPLASFKNNYFQGYFVLEVYDLREFIFYLIIPILIYFIIKLWNQKTVKDSNI